MLKDDSCIKQIVDEALKTLTDRERLVLELRYGHGGKPVTQKDLGIELSISGSRIGQIEEGALRKLRHPYRIKKLQPFLYQAVSQGKDNFYACLFTKLFKLKPEHIRHILESGPSDMEKHN